MYQKKLLWLLCATILSSQPAFASEKTKLESNPPINLKLAKVKLWEEPSDAKAIGKKVIPLSKEDTALPNEIAGGLTLEQAIDKAISNSPRLKSSDSARLATQGELTQAGTLPNPELSVEAENFAGGGSYKGLDSAEVTYGVSQLIEVGGKRSARINIADKGLRLSEIELEIVRLNLIRDVTTTYAEAVAAEEEIKLARQQKDLATEILDSVTKRVNAAADPLYQKSKAEVTSSNSIIALDKAEREAKLAKQKLAALWGDDRTDFELSGNNFFNISEPEPLKELANMVENNPDYLKWDTQLEQSNAIVDLEKANAIPDPSLNVGVRDFRDTGDQAFIVGISLPIPVFNSNSGNISKARYESLKTETDLQAARLELTTELNRHWQELQNSYKESEALKNSILPAAQKSFDLARHGYGIGKFPYLDVLDAQRTLFETREQYIDSLRQYNISRAEVERLTAKNANNDKTLEVNHGK